MALPVARPPVSAKLNYSGILPDDEGLRLVHGWTVRGQGRGFESQCGCYSRIGNPIAMYAKRVNTKVPRENEPTGFDLMAGDWVSPFGAGKNTDLFLKVERHVVSDREYDARLEISFPNEGDGIVALPPVPDTGSELLMPPTASAEAYAPTRVWRQARTPSGPAAGPEPVLGYFFRTRTILTEKAEIKSALYGKIMGDIDFYVGTRAPKSGIGFTYYLNPTPNDRNVEFDPKQNLLPASKRAEERVKRP